jgi:hypothetical protein
MENTPGQKMSLKVGIDEINTISNEVYISDGNGNEGWFPVKAPANLKWIKLGRADVTIDNGAIVYARNEQSGQAQSRPYPSKPGFGAYPKKEFNHFPEKSSPVNASQYEPEKKESKRIGMTKELIGASLEEIRLMYNGLSMSGKWIVATNIFPRADAPGKYDCMFFISEEREGFDKTPYMNVSEKNIDSMSKDGPKMTSLGVF